MQRYMKRLREFRSNQQGAVTIDWVVLTAALVSMGMVAGMTIWGETGGISEAVASFIDSQEVATTF